MMRPTLCRVAVVIGWAAAATACGGPTDPAETGDIRVTVTTSGPEPDRNGYRVRVDDVTSQGLGLKDIAAFEVEPGSHSVALGDLADNCVVSDGSTRNVTVAAGVTEEVAFQVTCTPGSAPGEDAK